MPERDTTAFLIGRAAHTLILEGRQRYEREYAVGEPINAKTGQPFGSNTKAFAEWTEKPSKPVLSDAHAALVEQMAAAVRAHSVARELVAPGVAEGVVRGHDRGHASQARTDWINFANDIGIVDLKTTDDLDSFEFALRALGYVHQPAFYRAMAAIACGRVLPVRVVAVEKREPSRCGVWQITPAALEQAREQNKEAMFDGRSERPDQPFCFETFPQAIACALSGTIVSAKQKRSVRRALLNRAGVDTSTLTNIDQLDAALCALTAHHLALGRFRVYGEVSTGVIVVPNRALAG